MSEPSDALLERAQALVGTVLRDKWRLDRLIGVGGMASVFSATHRNGRRGAVKLLHTELALDKTLRSRFLREGLVANKVAHPGMVEILDDDDSDPGTVFLVMELLEGESVDRRWIRHDRRLPVAEVLAIYECVLDVLVAAHEGGIVHRDMKPENVFITRAGDIKLLDFGIARLRDLSPGSTATRFGTTLGTPAFMSPEQALGRNEEVDGLSDLWAVGASMFTLLTGRHVHGGKTVNEQLVAAATLHATPVLEIDPDIPAPIARLVDKALSFEKADRYQSAREMQTAVREAYLELYGADISTVPQLEVPLAAEWDPLDEARTHALPSLSGAPQRTIEPSTASRPAPWSIRPAPRNLRWIYVVGGVSLTLFVALTGWRAGWYGNSASSDASPLAADAAAAPSASTPVSPSSTPIEALPLAASASAAPASSEEEPPEGTIAVYAEGGSCAVTVDGKMLGPPPVTMSVPPGEHHVICSPRDGASQSRTLLVRSRQTTRASFRLSAPAPAPSASSQVVDPRDRRK